jgi:hypothetical protein
LSQFLRLPQPGGPSPRIYIPQEQGGPDIPPGTGFPLHRLLRLPGTKVEVFYPTSTRELIVKYKDIFTLTTIQCHWEPWSSYVFHANITYMCTPSRGLQPAKHSPLLDLPHFYHRWSPDPHFNSRQQWSKCSEVGTMVMFRVTLCSLVERILWTLQLTYQTAWYHIL